MMMTEQNTLKRYDSPEQYAKAEYIVIFISEFARRFGLSALQAYRYLNHYKTLQYLEVVVEGGPHLH